jgi:nucleotide-binding universal stress UspA family protein
MEDSAVTTSPSAPKTPIVIAYDGSEEAAHAIEAAGRLLPGADVVVLYVRDPGPLATPPPAGAPILPGMPDTASQDDELLETHAREIADSGVEAARAAGLVARSAVARAGGTTEIAHAILRAADDHHAAAIVIGSRGRSGIKAAILGSVSNAVVHAAHVPVLVVPRAS